jgi:pimeloyl-ACP methyl ester carboxylesterase
MLHFLQQVGIYRAVLVGYSMGGAVALEMARQQPEAAAGLGLIASGAYLAVDAEILALLGRPISVSLGLQKLAQRLFAPGADPRLVKKTMAPLQAARPSLLHNDWLACARFDLRPKISQISAPAWIACGQEDQLAPVEQTHFLAAHLPGSTLQIIPACGHMVILEQPELLAEGLRRFLERLFSGYKIEYP